MEANVLSVWKVAAHGKLHWLDWDGQYLLYDDASGDTHLMDAVGAAVFLCLQRSPGRDEIELLHEVAALLELPPEDRLLDRVHEILLRFARVRLLQREDP